MLGKQLNVKNSIMICRVTRGVHTSQCKFTLSMDFKATLELTWMPKFTCLMQVKIVDVRN